MENRTIPTRANPSNTFSTASVASVRLLSREGARASHENATSEIAGASRQQKIRHVPDAEHRQAGSKSGTR